MKTSILKIALLSFASMTALTGCISTTSFGAGAERKQLIMVSQAHVEKKADKEFAKKLHRKKGDYWHREQRLVNIMNTMIPYADEYTKAGEKIEWAIHDWPTKKLNAGALANGIVVLAPKIAYNKDITDNELAFIIAHEMAHIVRQHHRESATFSYILRPALIGTAVLTSGTSAIVGGIGHDVYGNGFKRVAEKEADLLGLEIYTKAGYSPDDAISVLRKFQPLLKKHHPFLARIPSFLSTHPSFKQREKQIWKHYDQYKAVQAQHIKKESDNLITHDFNKGYIKIDNFTVKNPAPSEVNNKEVGVKGFVPITKGTTVENQALDHEQVAQTKPDTKELKKDSSSENTEKEMKSMEKVETTEQEVQFTKIQNAVVEPSV